MIFLAACAAGQVELESGKSDADADADTDSDADSDTDADSDSDADTGEEFVPETDWEAGFTGWRNFYYEGYCDTTLEEVGTLVEEGSQNHEDLSHSCGDCTYFFEVDAEGADDLCDSGGWVSAYNPSWRGVALAEDGSVTVYFYAEGDRGVEEYASDEEASFDDENIGFYYFAEVGGGYGLDVTGEMTFPMTTGE